MAYQKPGVEITQRQVTKTPILTEPELQGVMVGNAYWIQDINWESDDDPLRNSVSSYKLDGVQLLNADGSVKSSSVKSTNSTTSTTLPLNDINDTYYDVDATNDEKLVTVDLIGKTGDHVGQRIHLENGTLLESGGHFTVISNQIKFATSDQEVYNKLDIDLTGTIDLDASTSVSGTDTKFTEELKSGDFIRVGNETLEVTSITDNTNLTLKSASSETTTDQNYKKTKHSTYEIKVGYRAAYPDSFGYHLFRRLSDIENTLGSVVSWNPLAYGTDIAMLNAASEMYALGIDYKNSKTAIDGINDTLSFKDVYVIGVMEDSDTSMNTALKSHVNTYSSASEKKERVGFFNPIHISSTNSDYSDMTTTEKANYATTVRDYNSTIGAKRIFSVYPDGGYVVETRHISTIDPDWIVESFSNFSIRFSNFPMKAKFFSDTTVGGNKYKAGQEITSTIFSNLLSNNKGDTDGMITVMAPVPGFYFVAQEAGLVIGTSPSQSLTNVSGSGMYSTYGSQDLFTESDLNTMASGGTWIMIQDGEGLPIYSRHQSSTNVTSVTKREFSVTKEIDYASKTLRASIKPHIGNKNITASYLKLMRAIVKGVEERLQYRQIIKSIEVISIEQDDINPDTVNIALELEVFYPANYVKILLKF